jgi:ketosteroid isomerase-like protein
MDVDTFVRRWAAAELAGDHESLRSMLTDDFRAVGPLGFILTKAQWLERYEAANLKYETFTVTETEERQHGPVTLVIGVQTQQGSHQGQSVDARLRITLVIDGSEGDLKIAGVHLSPIMAPPRPMS